MSLWHKIAYKFSYKSWEYRYRVLQERLRGVDFSVVLQPEDVGLDSIDFRRSSPSGDKWLRNVLKGLPICAKDSIIDIGCGKGSAMKIMLDFPFLRVDGIEISKQITAIARNNFTKLWISPNRCKIFTVNASDFKELHAYNYVYLYNPFSSRIMKNLVGNLCLSIKQSPRKVTIIYNNPVCHSELISNQVFYKVAEYPDKWGNMFFLYKNHNP